VLERKAKQINNSGIYKQNELIADPVGNYKTGRKVGATK
jgi:hypothetical protein